MRAYDTAHSIRTVMLSNVSSQAQVRFKGKVCRDIKLSGDIHTRFSHRSDVVIFFILLIKMEVSSQRITTETWRMNG